MGTALHHDISVFERARDVNYPLLFRQNFARMFVRASCSSSKSARLLLRRVRLPESHNAESLRFGQSSHDRGAGYIGSVTQTRRCTGISDRIYQVDIDSALKHPTPIKSSSSSTQSIVHTSLSRPPAQFSRLQTSRSFSSSSRLKASFTFSLLDSDPTMASLTPPQAPPRWNHSPEDVLSITKHALAQNKAVSDTVAALPEAECNFETVSNARSYLHPQTENFPSTHRFS